MMTVGELKAALEGLDDDTVVAMTILVGGCAEATFEAELDDVGEPLPEEGRDGFVFLEGSMVFRDIPFHVIDEIQCNIIAEECAFDAGARGWAGRP